LQQHPPILFSQKKKGKKRKPSHQWRAAKVQGRRRHGAVYIPLLLCQPGTYICCSFLFFWANNQHRHFRGGGRGYGGQALKGLTSAFAIGNREGKQLIKTYGLCDGWRDVLMGCLCASGCVGHVRLLDIIPAMATALFLGAAAIWWGCSHSSYYVT